MLLSSLVTSAGAGSEIEDCAAIESGFCACWESALVGGEGELRRIYCEAGRVLGRMLCMLELLSVLPSLSSRRPPMEFAGVPTMTLPLLLAPSLVSSPPSVVTSLELSALASRSLRLTDLAWACSSRTVCSNF